MPNPHRLVRAALVAALTTPLIVAGPAVAKQGCANANAAPGSVANVELKRALRCVVNQERAARGMRPLRGHKALTRAARRHARDMVGRGYFAHERPGSTTASRLREAGWNGAAAGEALAWGCGGLGEPRAIVDGWLASPPHRELVLGRYERGGIGFKVGAPQHSDCPGAGTWVLVTGRS